MHKVATGHSDVSLVTLKDIQLAASSIRKDIRSTPILTNSEIDAKCGGRKVSFKAEMFQQCGSFKTRGAFNALVELKNRQPQVPCVVTHSSGNFGKSLGKYYWFH